MKHHLWFILFAIVLAFYVMREKTICFHILHYMDFYSRTGIFRRQVIRCAGHSEQNLALSCSTCHRRMRWILGHHSPHAIQTTAARKPSDDLCDTRNEHDCGACRKETDIHETNLETNTIHHNIQPVLSYICWRWWKK